MRLTINKLHVFFWPEESLKLIHTPPVNHCCVVQGAVQHRLSGPRLLSVDVMMKLLCRSLLSTPVTYEASSGKMAILFSYRRLWLTSIVLCACRGGLGLHLEHVCHATGGQREGAENNCQLPIGNCRCGLHVSA